MREYIDREVAREYLHNACESIGGNGGLMLKLKFDAETPADVRENVHGEWISTKTNVYPACYTIRCSVCNFIAFYSGIEDNNKDCGYNFCPNCGADMRKEVEE